MPVGWRGVFVILSCCSCAGDLEDPERFSFLLDGGAQGPQGGTGSSVEPVDVSPPECLTTLFAARCGTAESCHATGSRQLDLVSPDVGDRLIDQKSETTACKDRVYVTTDGMPSLLLLKVDGSNPPCGLPMPLGAKLTAEELMCVADWVGTVGTVKGGGS